LRGDDTNTLRHDLQNKLRINLQESLSEWSEHQKIVVDSGATRHSFHFPYDGHVEEMEDIENKRTGEGFIQTADGNLLPIGHIVDLLDGKFNLKDVILVQGLRHKLLSISAWCLDQDGTAFFHGTGGVLLKRNQSFTFSLDSTTGLYILDPTNANKSLIVSSCFMTIPKRTKTILNMVKTLDLHRRMGHACLRAMRHTVGSNIELSPIQCETCMQVFPPNYKWNSRSTYESAGTKLHADLNGPYESCLEGHRYVLVLVDEGSRFIWSFPMKRKSELRPS
jgi:hypothetical protein